MSELTLRFDMDDPDDMNAAELAQKGQALYFAAQSFAEHLRHAEKYGEYGPAADVVLDEMKERFWEEFEGLLE